MGVSFDRSPSLTGRIPVLGFRGIGFSTGGGTRCTASSAKLGRAGIPGAPPPRRGNVNSAITSVSIPLLANSDGRNGRRLVQMPPIHFIRA